MQTRTARPSRRKRRLPWRAASRDLVKAETEHQKWAERARAKWRRRRRRSKRRRQGAKQGCRGADQGSVDGDLGGEDDSPSALMTSPCPRGGRRAPKECVGRGRTLDRSAVVHLFNRGSWHTSAVAATSEKLVPEMAINRAEIGGLARDAAAPGHNRSASAHAATAAHSIAVIRTMPWWSMFVRVASKARHAKNRILSRAREDARWTRTLTFILSLTGRGTERQRISITQLDRFANTNE